jgi:hypothetical protein
MGLALDIFAIDDIDMFFVEIQGVHLGGIYLIASGVVFPPCYFDSRGVQSVPVRGCGRMKKLFLIWITMSRR